MSIKPILALIGFLGWSALCTHWYCCWMQVACESCGAEAYAAYNAPPIEPIATTSVAVPVAYQWAKAQLNDDEQLRELEARISKGMEENNILEITGLYFEEEPQPEQALNLGLARADQLKEYLLSKIPAERIRTKSRVVSEPDGVRERGFYSIEFKWLAPDQNGCLHAGTICRSRDHSLSLQFGPKRLRPRGGWLPDGIGQTRTGIGRKRKSDGPYRRFGRGGLQYETGAAKGRVHPVLFGKSGGTNRPNQDRLQGGKNSPWYLIIRTKIATPIDAWRWYSSRSKGDGQVIFFINQRQTKSWI